MKEEKPTLETLEIPRSLREMAFRAIKQAILFNHLKPGVLFSEPALAKQLGISRTPVREALLDLASRGFIDFVRNKGFQVKEIEEKKIQDLYHYRRLLEKAILWDITPKLTPASLRNIETLINQLAETHEHFRYLELDRQLHLYLASLTGNPFVIDSLENLKDLTDWVRSKTLLVKDRLEKSHREHYEILKMLKKRDAQKAAEAMERHLRLAAESLLERLELKEKLKKASEH